MSLAEDVNDHWGSENEPLVQQLLDRIRQLEAQVEQSNNAGQYRVFEIFSPEWKQLEKNAELGLLVTQMPVGYKLVRGTEDWTVYDRTEEIGSRYFDADTPKEALEKALVDMGEPEAQDKHRRFAE